MTSFRKMVHTASEKPLLTISDVYEKNWRQFVEKLKKQWKEAECSLSRHSIIIMLPLSIAVNVVIIVVALDTLVAEEKVSGDDKCDEGKDNRACIRAANCTGSILVGKTLNDQQGQRLCCSVIGHFTGLLLSVLLGQQPRNNTKWNKLPNLTVKAKLSPAVQAFLDVDALAEGKLLWVADNPYGSDGFMNSIINNGDHFIILNDGMYAIHSQMELRALGLKRPKTFTHKIIRRIRTGNGVTGDNTILHRGTKMSPGDMTFTSSVLNEHLRLYKGDVLFVNVSDVSFVYQATTTNSLNMFRL